MDCHIISNAQTERICIRAGEEIARTLFAGGATHPPAFRFGLVIGDVIAAELLQSPAVVVLHTKRCAACDKAHSITATPLTAPAWHRLHPYNFAGICSHRSEGPRIVFLRTECGEWRQFSSAPETDLEGNEPAAIAVEE